MNVFCLPPTPNFYQSAIITCTSDNTVIYGSMGDIISISPAQENEAPIIRCIYSAHDKVFGVAVNNSWGHPDKKVVSVGEDRVVRLWYMDTSELISHHKLHKKSVIGVTYPTDDRIISISEDAFIVLWRPNLNETKTYEKLIPVKSVEITAISSCPHASWLIALGTKRGPIFVIDLRREGKLIYTLRGHQYSIVSLSWCPEPINVFPETTERLILTPRQRIQKTHVAVTATTVDMLENAISNIKIATNDSVDSHNLENPQYTEQPSIHCIVQNHDNIESNSNKLKENVENIQNKKTNPWVNLKHADDDDDVLVDESDKALTESFLENDFLADCTSLKYRILGEKILKKQPVEESNLSDDACEKDFKIVSAEAEADNSSVRPARSPITRNDFLLASSGKGSEIIIWRAGTDGRIQLELKLPSSSHRDRGNKWTPNWIALHWISPTELLSSSSKAELLIWELLKYTGCGRQPKPRIFHCDHRKVLFAIVSAKAKVGSNRTIWTIGHDRMILETAMDDGRELISKYPTLGGIPTSFASSAIDPNRIAVGMHDTSINFWNVSKPHLQYITMSHFYQKNFGKICSMSWHPTQEHLLAFATAEGKIGVVDTNSLKGATFFKNYFKNNVHKIEWAPFVDMPDEFCLYACGDGDVVYFDMNVPTRDPNVIDIEEQYVTNMAWKSDYEYFALATKTPEIMLLSKNLTVLRSIYVQQKIINQMLWHPLSTLHGDTDSSCANWLAIANRSGNISVYDFSQNNPAAGDSTVKPMCEIAAHGKQINSLSWSSFVDGKLVSGSDDFCSQVWDIGHGAKHETTYICPSSESITAVMWSPVNEKLIISGCPSGIRVWNQDDHTAKSREDIDESTKAKFKLKNKYYHKHKETLSNCDGQNFISEHSTKQKKRENLLKSVSRQQNATEALADCRTLFTDGPGDHNQVTRLFGNHDDVVNLMSNQQSQYENTGRHQSAQILSLYKGDLEDTIQKSIQKGSITPWLISLAPLVSPKLWQEACLSYAESSLGSPDYDAVEVATYFLAAHEIHKAIDVLLQGAQYREALALAKCRLPVDDVCVPDILSKWAKHSIITGHYELSAQCFIVLKNYEEAAKVLFKRTERDALQLAADLAQKTENEELKSAIQLRISLLDNVPNVISNIHDVDSNLKLQ